MQNFADNHHGDVPLDASAQKRVWNWRRDNQHVAVKVPNFPFGFRISDAKWIFYRVFLSEDGDEMKQTGLVYFLHKETVVLSLTWAASMISTVFSFTWSSDRLILSTWNGAGESYKCRFVWEAEFYLMRLMWLIIDLSVDAWPNPIISQADERQMKLLTVHNVVPWSCVFNILYCTVSHLSSE